MLLGDIIKEYRTTNKLSQRDFAKKCNLSHTYISALEKKIDTRSGRPIAPTIEAVKNISIGLEIPLQELLNMLDDTQEFTINQSIKEKVLDLSELSEEDFDYIKSQVDYLKWKHKKK